MAYLQSAYRRVDLKLTVFVALVAHILFGCAVTAVAQLPTSAIADQTAKVGTRQIHYLRAGSGKTTIVLLHGWPQSSHEWRRVMPLLADRFTVIAPDLPGIGGSTGADEGASALSTAFEKASLARELHAFVVSLAATRIVLVGHDIGGMVAYAYARLYPDELAGLAIVDVPLPGIAPWDKVKTLPQSWHFGFHRQEPLAEQLVAGRQALYFRYFINSVAVQPAAISDEDVAAYAEAYRSPASLRAGFGFYQAFTEDEVFNAHHREELNVPVLLAGADHSMGPAESQLKQGLTALGVQNVRIAVIANSGHWLAEEQPSTLVTVLGTFASSLP